MVELSLQQPGRHMVSTGAADAAPSSAGSSTTSPGLLDCIAAAARLCCQAWWCLLVLLRRSAPLAPSVGGHWRYGVGKAALLADRSLVLHAYLESTLWLRREKLVLHFVATYTLLILHLFHAFEDLLLYLEPV